MKKLIVLGASGEVGYRFIQSVYGKYQITAVVRDPLKKDFTKYPDVKLEVVDDVQNVAAMTKVLDGQDVVLNTGYIWFAKKLWDAIHNCKKKPEHIVFTGSTGVLTKLPSPGADKKRVAEKYIQDNYSIAWTIIRPTMIYGHKDDRNISKLARVLKKTPIMPLIGKGNALIQPVYYGDLIKSFQLSLLNPNFYNKIYNIGGDSAVTNKELFQIVSRVMKTKVYFISIPFKLILNIVRLMIFLKISPIIEEQVYRFEENKNVDNASFIKDFGFIPISFNEGVKLLKKDL